MEQVADSNQVAISLKLINKGDDDMSRELSSRGLQLLSRLPRLPTSVANDIADYFGSLQCVMRATEDNLDEVIGVGEARSRSVKERLSKITEASIIDRYR
jgi:diadenylate cyclase